MASTSESSLDLFEKWHGHIVPRSFNAGFVTLSYIVSLIGAWSTLELINRRTAPKGRINHLLLVSAAVTMGGISIWCMHYIGNRAIQIDHGQVELQIAYSSGFTALSFFMPIIVLLVAFVALGTNEKVSWWRVAFGGTLAGTAICGMHYLGNASINNYVCIYTVPNVVGAALIAVAASIIALSVFFVLRSSWTNSWWKRGMTAVTLAGAVSGMHWCASTGTQYKLVALNETGGLSRSVTVIVVICLSASACLVMAGFAMYTARLRQRYANKAQQIVLAAAVFDKHGRVLVSPEGLLPSEKITDTFLEKTPNDSFTVAHPLFHWMFQASRNWSSINTIIGGIANHLAQLPRAGRTNIGGDIQLITDHGELVENYEIIFRELFCAAAAGLADKTKTSLTSVGILWDEIIATGGRQRIPPQVRRRQVDIESSAVDGDATSTRKDMVQDSTNTHVSGSDPHAEEKYGRQQIVEIGRGSLMFLIRRVENNNDVQALAAAGYRFAELHQVSGIIGSTMQIKTRDFEKKLHSMSRYSEQENSMLEPGVHVGLFGVRACVNDAWGFDVLARKEARNLLPSVQMLPVPRLDAWQEHFLRQLDGMTPTQLVRRIHSLEHLTPKEMAFASQLTDSVQALRNWIEDPIFEDAVLCPKTVEVPCRAATLGSSPGLCTIITFKIVIPIHLHINSSQCEFLPLNLFKVHQLVYQNSPNHIVFARSVHRNIAPIVNAAPMTQRTRKGSEHSRGSSLRDNTLASKFFRVPRPLTSGRAVDSDGNPIPMVLRRPDSGAGSYQTTSTLKLWQGRHSSDDHGAEGMGYERPFSSPPPPAYGLDELGPPTVPQSPISGSTLNSNSMAYQQPASSFGGIMVSQEITVNVLSTEDELNAGGGTIIETGAANRRRQPSHGGAGGSVDARSYSHSQSHLAAEAHQRKGGEGAKGAAVGIELASLGGDDSYAKIGTGVQVSNIEAGAMAEVPTFVDELFALCVQGR